MTHSDIHEHAVTHHAPIATAHNQTRNPNTKRTSFGSPPSARANEADGLAFSVRPGVELTPTLRGLFRGERVGPGRLVGPHPSRHQHQEDRCPEHPASCRLHALAPPAVVTRLAPSVKSTRSPVPSSWKMEDTLKRKSP